MTWRIVAVLAALATVVRVLVALAAPGTGTAAHLVGAGAPVLVLLVALAPRTSPVAALAPRTSPVAALAPRASPVAALAPFGVVGLLGIGQLGVDLTLVVDPVAAARPELMASGTTPLPGLLAAALVAADVLLVAAGVVALTRLRALRRAAGAGAFGRQRPAGFVRPVGGALLAAAGLVAAPFTVHAAATGAGGGATGFAPHSALDTAAPAGPGLALLAVTALVLAVAPVLASATPPDDAGGPDRAARPDRRGDAEEHARGRRVRRAVHTTLGVALVAAVAPVVAASIDRDGLAVSPGAVLVVVGGLLVAGLPARTAVLRSRAAGLAALLTAGASLLAGLVPTLTSSGPFDPSAPGFGAPVATGTGILLLPAAIVLAVPAVLVVVGSPRLVVRVRPTLSVAWLTVFYAAGPALDVVLAAVDAPGGAGLTTADGLPAGTGVALGGWAVLAALVGAVVTAAVAVGAGFAERRDVAGGWAPPGSPLGARPADGTDTVEPDPTMLPMAALAAVLAVPGFGGPLARDALAANAAGGLWQNPGAAAWGSLAGVVGVAVACLLAPRARPARALALLGAAGALLVVRLSALVLTPPQPGESVGAGTWAAVVCLVVTLGAAGVAVWRIVCAARS